MEENALAFEMHDRIVQLSDLQHLQWQKGKKQMSGYFPTLSKMDFVFTHYLPQSITSDELDFLIEKIAYIHNLKLKHYMG